MGGPLSNQVTYGYDAANRLSTVTDWNSTQTAYSHDDANRMTAATLPNGVVSTSSYDNANRLTGITHVKGATTLASVSYTYDAAGELTSDGTNTYTYDANGNLTARGSDSFSYDAASRMTGATVGGTATSYTYDGDGVRTAKTVGAGTPVTYLWDRESGLPLLIDDGAAAYVQANGPVEDIDGSGTASYHLDDALGSTRGLTDGSGAVTGTLGYDVFGATRSASGATSALAFTGQQTDAETGFTFLRSRYMDPSVGRFTTADSVQPNAPGTQGYNLYSYVANNPTTWADPSGHLVAPAAGFAGVWEELTLQDALWQGCLRMPDCSPLLVQSVGPASEGRYNPAVTNGAIALLVCALEAECRTLAFRLEKTLVEHAPRVSPSGDPATNPEPAQGPVDPPVPFPPVPRPPDRCAELNAGLRPLLLQDDVDHIRERHGIGGSLSDGNDFPKHWDDEDWEEYLGRIVRGGRQGTHWNWDGSRCVKTVGNPDRGGWVKVFVLPGPPPTVDTMFPVKSGASR